MELNCTLSAIPPATFSPPKGSGGSSTHQLSDTPILQNVFPPLVIMSLKPRPSAAQEPLLQGPGD